MNTETVTTLDEETRKQVHAMEHQWLPFMFFERQEQLITELFSDHGPGHVFVNYMNTRNLDTPDYQCPFTEDSIQIKKYETIQPSVSIIRLTMPEFSNPLLSSQIFLAHDETQNIKLVFTLEHESDQRDVLCAWEPDRHHITYYLDIPEDPSELVSEVFKLFRRYPEDRKVFENATMEIHDTL